MTEVPDISALAAPSGTLVEGGAKAGAGHLYALRVFYEDTDLSGVAYHANYLKWFERARSDLVRLLGIDQRAAVEAGEGAYAVAEMHIRYAAPARLDDELVIYTQTQEIGAASVRLVQRAFRRDGQEAPVLLAQAQVRVGFVAPDGRPRRQPAAWRAAFADFGRTAATSNPTETS